MNGGVLYNMKKYILIFSLIAGIIVTQVVITSRVSATTPYDNNKNFAYAGSGMGTRFYLDLRTVKILMNDPPYYMINGDVIHFDVDHNRVYKTINMTHFYNAISYETYIKSEYTNNNWSKCEIRGDYSVPSSNRKFADVFFKAAFGRDFYGESFGIQKNLRFANVKNIEYSRMALGGIQLGSTKERVRATYGNPNSIKEHDDRNTRSMYDGYVEEWTYGNSFKIIFVNGYAEDISSTAKNGIKTPDGISVGDDIRKLYKTFGTANRVTGNGRYTYYSIEYYYLCISFAVKDDKIISIDILVE